VDLDGDGVVEALCLSTDSTDGLPRYSLKLIDTEANTTEWVFWLDWSMAGSPATSTPTTRGRASLPQMWTGTAS